VSEVAPSPAENEPASLPNLRRSDLRAHRRRRLLPLLLFLATCLSMFWAGSKQWVLLLPETGLDPATTTRWLILVNWKQGLIYTASLVAILAAHEMGHFITSQICRIAASWPYFIPLPVSPIGTMGAVIGMEGHRANRRQIFDIGIAGPLAGLMVILPVLCLGIARLDLSIPRSGGAALDCPLLVRWLLPLLRPDLGAVDRIWISQLNSPLMAAWVGLLVTGLNMLPMSQLDGGHVIYALLLKRAYVVARGFLIAAILYVVIFAAYLWLPMILLVTLIGVDHPPTSDDTTPLGWPRTLLGVVSLSIPIFCFPPQLIITYF
jgi:membrane-associated protease RseP (regulator of RpoE activity)